jgi:hypothetical protein
VKNLHFHLRMLVTTLPLFLLVMLVGLSPSAFAYTQTPSEPVINQTFSHDCQTTPNDDAILFFDFENQPQEQRGISNCPNNADDVINSIVVGHTVKVVRIQSGGPYSTEPCASHGVWNMNLADILAQTYCPATVVASWVLGESLPGAPVLEGEAGISNTLHWATVTDATSYSLFRGTTEVYTGSGLSYTDTDVTAGTGYSYKLVAHGASGDSPDSNTLSLTAVSASDVGSQTQITQRDMKLISFFLASLIAWFFIKQFRWRGYE